MKLQFMLTGFGIQPRRATEGSAGYDLSVPAGQAVAIYQQCTMVLHLGIAVAIPAGHVGIIVPRSSLGRKGLELQNTVGIIDSDYRGELILALRNVGPAIIELAPGDRIAQLLILPVATPDVEFVSSLDDTERGAGGFGSTGR